MDKTKAIEVAKEAIKNLEMAREVEWVLERQSTFTDKIQALQTLIAYAEKAPVWPEKRYSKGASHDNNWEFDRGFNFAIDACIAAYQEAAKGEKNG